MRWSTKAGTISILLIMGVVSTWPCRAADCGPGAQKLGEVRQGDQLITTCKCLPTHAAANRQCVNRLPVIDPAFFVSDEHAAFVRNELDRLRTRQDRLLKQMNKLNALRDKQDEYLEQMGELRQQLVFDTASDLLGIVGTRELLERIPNLRAADVDMILHYSMAMKGAIDAVAAAQAGPERERAVAKMADAAADGATAIGSLAAPKEYRDKLAVVFAVSAESVKAVDQSRRAVDEPVRQRVVKALDGIAGIAGAVVSEVGAARSAIDAIGSAYVIHRINSDKEAIVEALVSAQRAKLACDQRLAATEQQVNFFEIELKKAGH